MWSSRRSPADQFNAAKAFGLLGCGIAIAMMFGIFMVAADTYFNLWATKLGSRVMPQAFLYVGSIGIIALFVNQPDR
jgi:predicted small integral membrane protein